MKKNTFLILLTGILLTLCFAYTSTALSEDKKTAEEKVRKIAAKVNGKAIYEDQLTPHVEKDLRKYKRHGAQKDSPDLVKSSQKKALNEVIAQELLYQAGQDLTITDIGEKIDNEIKAMKTRHKSEEGFEAGLKAKNITINDLRESIKRNIYIEKYLESKGLRNPEVPEAEIKEFYEKNKGNFKREETIRVSQILIKADEAAKPEEKEQAQKRADKIRKEILEGKDFTEMAKENSDCVRSSSQGGDLGYLERGYMPPEFDKAAFVLKKGELSDIVRTKFGYHIIKVVDIKPEGIAPYDEVKDFIGKYLKEGIAQKKLASHVEGLKEKAKIEIFLN